MSFATKVELYFDKKSIILSIMALCLRFILPNSITACVASAFLILTLSMNSWADGDVRGDLKAGFYEQKNKAEKFNKKRLDGLLSHEAKKEKEALRQEQIRLEYIKNRKVINTTSDEWGDGFKQHQKQKINYYLKTEAQRKSYITEVVEAKKRERKRNLDEMIELDVMSTAERADFAKRKLYGGSGGGSFSRGGDGGASAFPNFGGGVSGRSSRADGANSTFSEESPEPVTRPGGSRYSPQPSQGDMDSFTPPPIPSDMSDPGLDDDDLPPPPFDDEM